MRTTLLTIGLIVAAVVGVMFLDDSKASLPVVGPSLEQICVETMQRSTPDLSWVAPGRDEKVHGREIDTVPLGELPAHPEGLVRVAGVLHAEFEWVALYPSRAAMGELWRAPWVALDSMRPRGPYRESISDRCVVVEGTYSNEDSNQPSLFKGAIRNLLRLDVWSTPHRPFLTEPPRLTEPPPPPRPPARAR